jgi:polysaccharide biosynthesis/export protein
MQIYKRVAKSAALYGHAGRIFNFSAMGLLCLLATSLSSAQTRTDSLTTISGGNSSRVAPTRSATSTSSAGQTYMGVISETPIYPGETVHVLVSDASDFSVVAQVSESGDIAIPMAGAVHLAGLNSEKAQQAIAERLMSLDLVTNPRVTVTVESQAMNVTLLGEVRAPGIYELNGRHLLADILATAGGMTSNTGRVIEISNVSAPDNVTALAWDPTMRNMANYNQEVHPGDRILVRPCGIAYVGGNVAKPGAYSLCGSPVMTLSELVAIAGGVERLSAASHTYLIRTRPDGSRIASQIDLPRIQKAKAADVPVQEDDIIYVSPSALKMVVNQAVAWAGSTINPIIYTVTRK